MIVASGLLEATTGAPLPETFTLPDVAVLADRQTGQLDKANADKAGVRRMGDTCEAWRQRALERAQERNKPWWKF